MCRTTQTWKEHVGGNYNHGALMELHGAARRRAAKKGVPFIPFFPEFRAKVQEQNGQCKCCGIVCIPGIGESVPTSLTVHRIVSSKGYVPGNIEVICRQCNEDIGELPEVTMLQRKHRALQWQIKMMLTCGIE